MTLPLTLPANIAGSMIINARMVGAIAHLRGYDVTDPHTQAVMMMTIAGSSAQTSAAALGVQVGTSLSHQAIQAIPMSVIRQVNKRAGKFLVAKYGTQRSAITLSKGVPVVGGLVGGSIDAALTRGIGSVAKHLFPAE